jgi:hypothetical protein
MPGTYQEFRERVFGSGSQGRDLVFIMQVLEASGAEGPEEFAAMAGGTYDLEIEDIERLADDVIADTGIIFPAMSDGSGRVGEG